MRFIAVSGVLLVTVFAQATAAEDKKNKSEEVKERVVVDYKSKTHGAVQVKSSSEKPRDWFEALQNGKRAFSGAPPRLGSVLRLTPGDCVIDVNRTQRKVTVEAGKMTILRTGDLMVESKRKEGFWLPKQGKETRLVNNPPIPNTRVALFAGTYTVYRNIGSGNDLRSLGDAVVKPGKKTVVRD